MSEVALPELRHVAPTTPVVLKGRVWTGLDTGVTEDGAVLLRGDRLEFVGAAGDLAAPADAVVVDTQGTLLPGLIDLHVHARPTYLAWFVAAGVTTVRDACNPWDMVEFMRGVPWVKPRLLVSGPLLDGPQAFFRNFGPGAVHEPGDGLERRAGAHVVATPAEAVSAVQRLAAWGVDHVKLYEQLAPDVYGAAVSEADRLGLPVMTDLGIVSTRGLSGAVVDARQALALGVRSIEHVSGYALAYQRLGGDPLAGELDATLLDDLAAQTVAAGVALVPTLMVCASLASGEALNLSSLPLGDLQDEVSRSLHAQWGRVLEHTRAHRARGQADWRVATELLRRVGALGGQIGAGTDTPAASFNLPGGGLHLELELLTQAGLSAAQALQAATSQAARIVGRDDLGVLRAGAQADVLVVGGDPLADIRATRDIRLVVQGGRALTPAHLRDVAVRQGQEALAYRPA